MRSSTVAYLAALLLLPACTDPVELDCAEGEAQRAGRTWVCVYPAAPPAACPASASHRITLANGVVVCATDNEDAEALCNNLAWCVVDAGARDASPTDSGARDASPADSGVSDTGTGDAAAIDSGLSDAGARDAGPTDSGSTGDASVPTTCSGGSPCMGGEHCENWSGFSTCYLDCGVVVDGGSTVAIDEICTAAFGSRSRCALRPDNQYRCSRPCDMFDRTSCGDGFSCVFKADDTGDVLFTECRSNGTSGQAGACPHANSASCQADMTCLMPRAAYECLGFCDPLAGDVLPPCPEDTFCNAFSRSTPAGELVGSCEPN